MNTTNIQERLLTDSQFVREQLNLFVTYYNLKHTIRWTKDRAGNYTESVAEHVFGMHVLCDYFLPLEDSEQKMDQVLIRKIITWHDMAEAVVSDMATKLKTKAHKLAEKQAEVDLIAEAPQHLKDLFAAIYSCYDEYSTPEARLVKAIDKIEPMFHLYFLKKKGINISEHYALQWEANEYRTHRAKYIDGFSILKRFDDILYEETKEYYLPK